MHCTHLKMPVTDARLYAPPLLMEAHRPRPRVASALRGWYREEVGAAPLAIGVILVHGTPQHAALLAARLPVGRCHLLAHTTGESLNTSAAGKTTVLVWRLCI